MRVLRRSRWLRAFAVLGAILAPGTGGVVLQTAHPCAVAAPWLVEDPTQTVRPGAKQVTDGTHASASHAVTSHASHEPGAHRSDVAPPADRSPESHGPHDGTCQCIGSCLSAAAALMAAGTPTVPILADAQPSSAGFAAVQARLAARLRELLPPATAPPIA